MKVNSFKSTINWYDQNAKQYAQSTQGRERIDQLNEFYNLVSKEEKVLDAGCAAGVNTAYLFNKGLDTIGLDVSKSLLEVARKHYPDIEFIEGSFLNLPFDNEAFGGIWAHGSIIHFDNIDDVKKTMSEFARVLKKDGILFLAVKAIKEGLKFKVKKDKLSGHDRFFQYFTQDEIKVLTEEVDLNVVNTYQVPESKLHLRDEGSVRKDDEWIFYFGKKN